MYLSKKKKKPASIQIYISNNQKKKKDYNINAKTIHTMALLEQQQ